MSLKDQLRDKTSKLNQEYWDIISKESDKIREEKIKREQKEIEWRNRYNRIVELIKELQIYSMLDDVREYWGAGEVYQTDPLKNTNSPWFPDHTTVSVGIMFEYESVDLITVREPLEDGGGSHSYKAVRKHSRGIKIGITLTVSDVIISFGLSSETFPLDYSGQISPSTISSMQEYLKQEIVNHAAQMSNTTPVYSAYLKRCSKEVAEFRSKYNNSETNGNYIQTVLVIAIIMFLLYLGDILIF